MNTDDAIDFFRAVDAQTRSLAERMSAWVPKEGKKVHPINLEPLRQSEGDLVKIIALVESVPFGPMIHNDLVVILKEDYQLDTSPGLAEQVRRKFSAITDIRTYASAVLNGLLRYKTARRREAAAAEKAGLVSLEFRIMDERMLANLEEVSHALSEWGALFGCFDDFFGDDEPHTRVVEYGTGSLVVKLLLGGRVAAWLVQSITPLVDRVLTYLTDRQRLSHDLDKAKIDAELKKLGCWISRSLSLKLKRNTSGPR